MEIKQESKQEGNPFNLPSDKQIYLVAPSWQLAEKFILDACQHIPPPNLHICTHQSRLENEEEPPIGSWLILMAGFEQKINPEFILGMREALHLKLLIISYTNFVNNKEELIQNRIIKPDLDRIFDVELSPHSASRNKHSKH